MPSYLYAIMNFLAHFYLSQQDENLLVGNFIADSVKGRQYENFKPEVARGIMMHRFIDDFMDQHPTVKQSKDLIRPAMGKYTPVVMDVFYDYFLARHWIEYADVSLINFSEYVYETLFTHIDIMPERNKHILKYMSQHNWLVSYSTLPGIGKALSGMSKRVAFANEMDKAVGWLEKFEQPLYDHFRDFFPQMEQSLKKQGY